ncbi:hypothetical protein HDU87_001470 [Geranomyces variabilis]|uniref:Uncharacterized protein n=1 Tax=Geranomyces variabilis TaxID=109894 RepID=A0AAD5TDH8_9FUNG|nr:hypothetical protein HDU87_001470 [Geranomyces variabilis]
MRASYDRACVFENICLNLPSGQLRYYRRPDSVRKPLFFDTSERELFDFKTKDGTMGFVNIFRDFDTPWSPFVVDTMCPAAAAPRTTFGLFATATRLDVLHDTAVPLWEPRGVVPDRPLWKKFMAAFLPAVTNHPVVDLIDYSVNASLSVPGADITDICFDELLVGGLVRRFIRGVDGDVANTTVSMEAALWNYFPHIKKQYYQINSVAELKADAADVALEQVDWRNSVSVVIDMERMRTLVEAAFEDMSL